MRTLTIKTPTSRPFRLIIPVARAFGDAEGQVPGSAAASFALGTLFDGLTLAPALYGVFALFTALAAAVFHASRRLSGKKAT